MKNTYTPFLLVLLVVGCSKKQAASPASGDSLFTGVVQAGRVLGAHVRVYAVAANGQRGALVATTESGSDGEFEVALGRPNGPVEIVATGGRYVDEATGVSVTLSDSEELSNVVEDTGGVQSVPVTPMTTQVSARVKSSLSNVGNFKSARDAAIGEVAKMWGTTAAVIDAVPVHPESVIDPNTDAGKSAFLLTSLSQYMKNQGHSPDRGVSPIAFLARINEDLQDGVMDGYNNGVQLDASFKNFADNWEVGFAQARADVVVNPRLANYNRVVPGDFDAPKADPENRGKTVAPEEVVAQVEDPVVVTGQSGEFVSTGALNVGRFSPSAFLRDDQTVAVVGGIEPDGYAANTMEIYDPRTGAFSLSDRQTHFFGAMVSIQLGNGEVLLMGGKNARDGLYSTGAEVLDLSTLNSVRTNEMAEYRERGFAVTLLDDGNVLVTGGYGFGCNQLNRSLFSTEIFDPRTKSFTNHVAMRVDHAYHSAVKLNDGRVLIAGGETCYRSALFGWIPTKIRNAEIYDPRTQMFTQVGPLAAPRSKHSAHLLRDGRVAIVGEGRSVEIFDPQTSQFSQGGFFSDDVGKSIMLGNGHILAMAGRNAYIYDPGTFEVTQVGPPTEPRGLLALIHLPSDQVLAIGGGYDSHTSVDIFSQDEEE